MRKRLNKNHLEIVVSVCCVFVVMASFYFWIDKVGVKIEKSKIDYSLSKIRSAVNIFELSMIVWGKQNNLSNYEGENPMLFMGVPIANYIGEVVIADEIDGGVWCYESSTGHLIYRVVNKELYIADGIRDMHYRLTYSNALGRIKSNGSLKLLLTENR